MTMRRLLLIAALLLTGAGNVAAQPATAFVQEGAAQEGAAPAGDWLGYREAYMQMIRFEKYGKPKQLIQNHFQVVPREKGAALDGLTLTLAGSSTSLNLPLDAAGRAAFPFSKSAYDDNARLLLSRKGYAMQPRVSIVPRADGVYDAADLRAACEQALDYLRYANKPGMQGKTCVGVRFSYPKSGADPVVRLRSGAAQTALAVEDNAAFADENGPAFRTVDFRFAESGDKSQVVTQGMPVAIAPLFK